MTSYIALRWARADAVADRAARRLQAAFDSPAWRCAIASPGWCLLVDDRTGIEQVRGGPGSTEVIVGQLFDRRATEQSRQAQATIPDGAATFSEFCTALTQQCWGAYVALGIEADAPGRLALFRDPIGMLDCVTWTFRGVRIATSAPEAILPLALPPTFTIDWPALGRVGRFPGSAGEELPLDGVNAVAAGTLLNLEGDRSEATQLWFAADFARHPVRHHRPPAEYLPDLVDATIAAWAGAAGPALAELSGGLDSAIVAAALTRCRPPANIRWLHYFGPDPQSDERSYAQAVARHLGVALEAVPAIERPIDAALMEDIPLGLRPSVASLSLFHDRDLADRGRAIGATCLYTGQGGDALFYQFPTLLLAADLWRDPRTLGAKLAGTGDLARWTGQSVWTIGGHAIRDRLRRPSFPDPHFPLDLIDSGIPRRAPALPWLDDTDDLPATKRLQILHIAATRAAFAPSWSNRAMNVVHPLMSQPLVEHALGLSALDLTRADRDRALVRSAYVRRLPAVLLDRRGKGSVTAYYGRMLARSVPFLRDYLLNGALAGHGIVDLPAVERVLDEDALMLTNCYAEIFALLFAERWARGWLGLTTAACGVID